MKQWYLLQIAVTQNDKMLSNLSIDYEPSCVSINQETGDVAVGSTSNNKVCSLFAQYMTKCKKKYLCCYPIYIIYFM